MSVCVCIFWVFISSFFQLHDRHVVAAAMKILKYEKQCFKLFTVIIVSVSFLTLFYIFPVSSSLYFISTPIIWVDCCKAEQIVGQLTELVPDFFPRLSPIKSRPLGPWRLDATSSLVSAVSSPLFKTKKKKKMVTSATRLLFNGAGERFLFI